MKRRGQECPRHTSHASQSGCGSLNSGIGVLLVLAIALPGLAYANKRNWLCGAVDFSAWVRRCILIPRTQPSTATSASQPVLALVGLWGSEQSFGPLVRGELTIDARGGEWRARIAGYEVPVEHTSFDQRTARFILLCPGRLESFAGGFISARMASAFLDTGYS